MKLLLVLTFKGSLEKWTKEGLVTREMEIYFEYLRRDYFPTIQLYSYSPHDVEFLEALPFDPDLKKRIELVMPEKEIHSLWGYLRHSLSIRKIHHAVKTGGTICKTNQINGCWTALLAGLFGAKVFLRCGYILSRRLFKNKNYLKAIIALMVEFLGVNFSRLVSVTTNDGKTYLSRLLLGRKNKIFVAPTYVNTEIFSADIQKKTDEKKILFVGRLNAGKNVIALVEACHLVGAPLTIVGTGDLQNKILNRAKTLGVPVTHYPFMKNEAIVDIFRTHRYFMLPSLHEGLPKVVIEAMSCEMVCLGTPTSGIRDLIHEGKTGYLADGFTPEALAKALQRAFTDPEAETYAQAARRYALRHHSIASYAERDYNQMASFLMEDQ